MKKIIQTSIQQFNDFPKTFHYLSKIALIIMSMAMLSIIVSLALFHTVISVDHVPMRNILSAEAILSISIKAYLLLFWFVITVLAGYVGSFITMKSLILIRSGFIRFVWNYLFKKEDAE